LRPCVQGFLPRSLNCPDFLRSYWQSYKDGFGGRYRTSPVSPLYLFGRSQDIALQKARASVDERNHLRLWLAPVRYKGMNIFLGQISRDIGIRLAAKTLVTHKIDPAVDEARTYLTLDLLASERLAAYGYVTGVGAAPFDDPRRNYTGDPYYTDGRRLVLIMADQRTDMLDLERLDWEPPSMPQSPPQADDRTLGDETD
jgi:LssY C-terminus